MECDRARRSDELKPVLWPLQPYDDESLLGLIARVADHNVLQHTFAIMRQVGQEYPHRTTGTISDKIDLRKLSTILKIDIQELSNRSYVSRASLDNCVNFFGVALRPTDVETRHRRFSPASLRRAPYHRALWDCRLLPVCTKSWEFLSDTCHRCGAQQRWLSAGGIASCDACSADLTEASASIVPAEMRGPLATVSSLLDPRPATAASARKALPPALHEFDATAVVGLLVDLLPVVDPSSPHRRVRLGWYKDPPRLLDALYSASQILLGWPESFFAQMRASSSGRASGPRDGSLRACSEFIRRVTVPTAGELAPSMLQLFKPMLVSSDERTGLPAANIGIKEASRSLRTGTAELAQARRANLLKTTFSFRERELVQTFDRGEIEHLSSFQNGRVGPEALAARFGIFYHGVEQLACMSLVSPAMHPYVRSTYGDLQFAEHDVARLENRLLDVATAPSALTDPMPLLKVVLANGGCSRPWGPILAELCSGKIAFSILSSAGPVTSRIVVSGQDTPMFAMIRFDRSSFPDFKFERNMSKLDAGEALGVMAHSAKYLDEYRVGLSCAKYHRVLPTDAIENLARLWISSREVTARTGLDFRALKCLTEKAGLPRAHPIGWSRRKVEALLEQLPD